MKKFFAVSFKTYIIVAFLLFPFNNIAQSIPQATQQQYQQFLKSKTYVVKYENPFSDFDSALKNAMEKNWYLTQWEIISSEDFEIKQKDTQASFLFLSEIMAAKRQDLIFNILNVVLGSKSGNLNSMPDLGSVPLSYASEDEEFEEDRYLYKLGVILRFIQYYAEMNIQKPGSDINALVKDNSRNIRNMEIWFLKDELDQNVNTPEKIKKFYDGEIRIVSVSEIEKAIEEKNKQVLILHKVGPGEGKGGKCLKFIISAENGAPYYFNMTDVSSKKPDAFLAEDFQKL